MKKLIITGASGFLGWHLCRLLRSQWDIYGTYQRHPLDFPDIQGIPLDLADSAALVEFFRGVQPDAVIHTAALSSPNACQEQPELSYRLNVVATAELASLCAAAQVPLVFTSSEQVFDGMRSPYCETDPVSPLNRYGEHKVMAEREVRSRYPTATVCRMPLMFGVAASAPSFLQPFLETLKAGKPLNLFTDEFRTPASGTTAAKGIEIALEHCPPVLHLGGGDRISRYAFGELLVELLQLSPVLLHPCLQSEVRMAAPRPADVSLDSSLAFSLGYSPKSIREELAAILGWESRFVEG
ncbi:MAG: NAD(P)-dependent oxidoreductase [Oculatellaceae cyanobacterium Prado106]|jgi:dTDP-4-dehydrorhamnose reductase|nr:NAD(P)-dependent oxidoreductase [Oculatellaceae cyanobacterium Prado106]